MINIPSLRPETRYGIPPADHYLFNREYIVGYSYLFKQPRWAAEVIGPNNRRVEIDKRTDSFRPDLRIPKMFRPGLEDYRGFGFDCGHLVASADRRASGTLNSETFLLTNMSPQHPKLNRQAWRILEEKVRDLSKAEKVVEVYAICGPLFEVGKEVTVIGDDPDGWERFAHSRSAQLLQVCPGRGAEGDGRVTQTRPELVLVWAC
jgi:endonuclease G